MASTVLCTALSVGSWQIHYLRLGVISPYQVRFNLTLVPLDGEWMAQFQLYYTSAPHLPHGCGAGRLYKGDDRQL